MPPHPPHPTLTRPYPTNYPRCTATSSRTTSTAASRSWSRATRSARTPSRAPATRYVRAWLVCSFFILSSRGCEREGKEVGRGCRVLDDFFQAWRRVLHVKFIPNRRFPNPVPLFNPLTVHPPTLHTDIPTPPQLNPTVPVSLLRPNPERTVQGLPRRSLQAPRGRHRVPLRRRPAQAGHRDHQVVPELQALNLKGLPAPTADRVRPEEWRKP